MTRRKKGLWIEWGFLFWVLPLLMWLGGRGFPKFVPLVLGTVFITMYLVRSPRFDNHRFFSRENIRTFFRGLLWKLPLVGLTLLAVTWLIAPQQLFFFPRQRPLIWLMVMIFYPVFSAFPQEIIYRAFFCHRYRDLFPSSRLLLVMNAVCFAFVHIAYGNLVGPLLTLPAGFLFARTYTRHHSVLLAAVEHGLYGALVFTVGLGSYFFHGRMG
ncbi:MAG: CPBP family intramembrane metalloprotease, partial [Candidatus Aminicenantes bacterium]|nr:CPBP family intramembrane metalloprotease [Candidatus Aminicenantes bacterium]